MSRRAKNQISAFAVYNSKVGDENNEENEKNDETSEQEEGAKKKGRKGKKAKEPVIEILSPTKNVQLETVVEKQKTGRKQKEKDAVADVEPPKKRGKKLAEAEEILHFSTPKERKASQAPSEDTFVENLEGEERNSTFAAARDDLGENITSKVKKSKKIRKRSEKSFEVLPPCVPEVFQNGAEKVENSKKKQKAEKIVSTKVSKENFCNLSGTTSKHKNFSQFEIDMNGFDDSFVAAEKSFTWMTFPVEKKTFMDQIWETKPFWINRADSYAYYQGLFSTEDLLKIIEQNELEYGVNLDVTQYVDGKRSTENPEGRVYAKVIQDFYNDGCSIRMLNPQTYSDSVWLLTSTLQEFFGTFVGANVYLTPAGTQGFAPHYDDIEAFVLQLEGKKHWSVYQPKDKLPRYSSRNFAPNEVGELVLSVELNPGDLLYMPRGFVHQASCSPTHHSLHITVSSTQLNSYADLFEKMVPQLLKIAVERDVEFRRSLPLDYMRFSGIAFEDSEKNNPSRLHFNAQVKTLFKRLAGFLPIDGACDQMSKKFIADSQPPSLSEDEKNRCISGAKVNFDEKKSSLTSALKDFDLKTEVRLIRGYCLRVLVEGDNEPVVYYNINNSRVYHGKELQKIDVTAEEASAVEFLIKSYPGFVRISSIPLNSDDDKVSFCLALYEKRLLMTKEPASPIKRSANYR